ncbi:hypothetical protein ACJ72_08050 [Emergomyces africanus]|uniref:Uncharacterized protein n=1 Tax=Emergomyces africanus TaxID=1955775 RepID=A0A1B7NLD4_9EURO|nr:hypothetical protein ACJ72_08050 [Emergomyces africanus]
MANMANMANTHTEDTAFAFRDERLYPRRLQRLPPWFLQPSDQIANLFPRARFPIIRKETPAADNVLDSRRQTTRRRRRRAVQNSSWNHMSRSWHWLRNAAGSVDCFPRSTGSWIHTLYGPPINVYVRHAFLEDELIDEHLESPLKRTTRGSDVRVEMQSRPREKRSGTETMKIWRGKKGKATA